MSDQALTKSAWLRGSFQPALPLTILLAVYEQCVEPILNAAPVSKAAIVDHPPETASANCDNHHSETSAWLAGRCVSAHGGVCV